MSVHPVILCGGAGVRLWPASRPARPKQFLPLVGPNSTFQNTLLRLRGLPGAARPIIVTGAAHLGAIREQLSAIGEEAVILIEPAARDSAPAMAAAAAWIAREDPEGFAVVLAADHHMPDHAAFQAALAVALEGARAGRIVTLGVTPRVPSAAYGYIEPGELLGPAGLRAAASFREKPDPERARALMAAGALWNSGNFVAAAATLLGELERHAPQVRAAAADAVAAAILPCEAGEGGEERPAREARRHGIGNDLPIPATNARGPRPRAGTGEDRMGDAVTPEESLRVFRLGPAFLSAPRISIDYAVMEKTARAAVLPVAFPWSDLGAWDAVFEASPPDEAGNVAEGAAILEGAQRCLVRAAPGQVVVAVNVSDLAVIAEEDAVLVCHLPSSQKVKAAVEKLAANGAHPVRGAPPPAGREDLDTVAASYRRWLFAEALPLWWALGADHGGADHEGGGFFEALDADACAVIGPRRARVQARQAFVFARAGALGWPGPWREAADHADAWFRHAFIRPDGLCRFSVDAAGAPANDRAFLYEQAFALLALAALGPEREADALALLAAVEGAFRHADGAFAEAGPPRFLSNPLMHLFEAALAWAQAGADRRWRALADELGAFALGRLIDARGFVAEAYDQAWRAPAEPAACELSPGHQFEWAFLFTRWRAQGGPAAALPAARRLYAAGARGLTAAGLAADAMDGAFALTEAGARLWPQCERLRAARALGDDAAALAAAAALRRYLRGGLWIDRIDAAGAPQAGPAPASSLYHLLGAVESLLHREADHTREAPQASPGRRNRSPAAATA
ncbi:MAG TPA: AGE family epimerase/isomerase [Caulobacteraceae bacterium]|nr:AGE family epimerase/isomerase [Caulobacteraceae bacterium]